MTPAEQEQLFVDVRRKFPDWTGRKASGYVHGVADALADKPIDQTHVLTFGQNNPPAPYGDGYVYGYYDAAGFDDVTGGPARMPANVVDFQWWTDETLPA